MADRPTITPEAFAAVCADVGTPTEHTWCLDPAATSDRVRLFWHFGLPDAKEIGHAYPSGDYSVIDSKTQAVFGGQGSSLWGAMRAVIETGVPHAQKQADPIDHPAHYGGGDNPYEAIKVMLAWHGPVAVYWFCTLSAEKYLSRAGKKSGEARTQDLGKAAWYINYANGLGDVFGEKSK